MIVEIMLIDLLPKLTKLLAEITDKSMQDLWKPVTHTRHTVATQIASRNLVVTTRNHNSTSRDHGCESRCDS